MIASFGTPSYFYIVGVLAAESMPAEAPCQVITSQVKTCVERLNFTYFCRISKCPFFGGWTTVTITYYTVKYTNTESTTDVIEIAMRGRIARSRTSFKLTFKPRPTIAAVNSHVVRVKTKSIISSDNGME